MQSIVGKLSEMFEAGLVAVLGEQGRRVDPLLRPATEPKFGDYQSNVAMGLAKQMKAKPREVAQRLVDAIAPAARAMVDQFEIAGPGFINIYLRDDWLADSLNAVPPAAEPDRLGIEPAAEPQTVVVDYSSPNVAKQMHVGHIRSTIIGDAIARILEFEGHRVIRQNHVGDWGTQFGLLIAYLKEKMPAALGGASEVHVADLESFYKEANALAGRDPAFAKRARAEVVALHRGDPAAKKAWQYIVSESRNHFMSIYRRLGVRLTEADERGESFYNDRLPKVVQELETKGIFQDHVEIEGFYSGPCQMSYEVSNNASCLFFVQMHNGNPIPENPLFKNPEGKPLPLIIQKSDKAYLYATTDLAALKYRIEEREADRIVYVTDARQTQHFQMVFITAQVAGWTRRPGKPEVKLEHASFGSILGEDRRPLKTRSGENIKLTDLLDEAVARAEQLIRSSEADPAKRRGFAESEIKDIAEAVGIGAIKYADLAQNRQSDYVFSWDKMLALDGNTAPYLMYAYARIRSIYRKGAGSQAAADDGQIAVNQPIERVLALQIARFAETLDSAAAGLKLNLLTDYLYELAGVFMRFYESCPVLAADSPGQRASRLRLCDLAARALRIGLALLGIRTLERM